MKPVKTTSVIVNYVLHTSDDHCHCEWMILIPTGQLYNLVQQTSTIVNENDLEYVSPKYLNSSDIIKNTFWLFDYLHENKDINGYDALIEKFEQSKKQTENEYFIIELTDNELRIVQSFDDETCELMIRKDDFIFKLETECNWYEIEAIPIDYLQVNASTFI